MRGPLARAPEYEERDGLLPAINVFFVFDPVRSDPRFQALLRKMNFPTA